MRGWWREFADLVLPADCGGCGRPRTVLCASCRAALCGEPAQRVRPEPEPAGLPVVYAAAPYADAVRAVLLAHKERGALGLAEALGAALAGAVLAGLGDAPDLGPGDARAANSGSTGLSAVAGQVPGRSPGGPVGPSAGPVGPSAGPVGPSGGLSGFPDGWPGGASGAGLSDRRAGHLPGRPPGELSGEPPGGVERRAVLLVPVPSSRRAVAARGHDPARRIALAASHELRRRGTSARVLPVLRQRRVVADQSGLNSRQRLANLTGALETAPGAERLLAGHRAVLVDDLLTTGPP